MIYLALTARGVRDALALARAQDIAIWCGADALSEDEFYALNVRHMTRFTYRLADADPATLACSIATIGEHHPGELIWVERPPSSAD